MSITLVFPSGHVPGKRGGLNNLPGVGASGVLPLKVVSHRSEQEQDRYTMMPFSAVCGAALC